MVWTIVIMVLLVSGMWFVLQVLERNAGESSNSELVVEGVEGDEPGDLYEACEGILTEAELVFYRVLREALRHPTDPNGADQAVVMCKVGMMDLVGVKKGLDRSTNQRAFNRIKSKHVDFVLVRPGDMGVMCVIELDDSSHNSKKAKARDAFVDSVYGAAGIPIVHVPCKGGYGKEEVAGVIRGAMGG